MDTNQFRAKDTTIRSGIEALMQLYEDESRWTRFVLARNQFGDETYINEGTCWCLIGGCLLVSPEPGALADHLRNTLDEGSLTTFNDYAESIAPIRGLLRRALETAHE